MTDYLLDTNVVSDITAPIVNPRVITQMDAHRQDTLYLCEAVDYEVRRGYLMEEVVKLGSIFRPPVAEVLKDGAISE